MLLVPFQVVLQDCTRLCHSYSGGCWLTGSWDDPDEDGLRVNDNYCNYAYTSYICSTNRWDMAPPPSPPSPPFPPPFPPWLPPPPSSPAQSCANWCLQSGICEDSTLRVTVGGSIQSAYCVFDGWRGFDTFLVENGVSTTRYDAENSCPPGRSISLRIGLEGL